TALKVGHQCRRRRWHLRLQGILARYKPRHLPYQGLEALADPAYYGIRARGSISMRGLLTTGLLLSAIVASAQTGSPAIPQSPSSFSSSTATDLPDAPGATQTQQESVVAVAHASFKETRDGAHPCNSWNAMKVVYFDPNHYGQIPKPCTELIYPYQRFLTTNIVIPLTWQQKGYSALHNLTDPANFGTIL